ncbi:MAG: hypothetical protein JWQ97_507 [Phenylobacterium sp.]|nr:hypothetical protein [Phenylobacterium sp.]
MAANLEGLRVLVVEDESAVAMLLEDMLADIGCTVSASAGSLAEAREVVALGGFDFALLDVNLAGERVFPIAETLANAAIPFAFVSGYGEGGLIEAFRDRPVVAKPFRLGDLAAVISRALAAKAGRPKAD